MPPERASHLVSQMVLWTYGVLFLAATHSIAGVSASAPTSTTPKTLASLTIAAHAAAWSL